VVNNESRLAMGFLKVAPNENTVLDMRSIPDSATATSR